jgi:hypothetical protein
MDTRPIILFELRFVLLSGVGSDNKRRVRPGIHHLLSLLQHFKVGFLNGFPKDSSDLRREDEKLKHEKMPFIWEALQNSGCTKVC